MFFWISNYISDILFKLGLIRRNHISLSSAAALIATYEGQTREKTQLAVNAAIGGVLFLDEAYSILNRAKQGYGKDALDQLMLAMNQPDPVIIMAGYEAEMEELIMANQGIRRRVKILHLEPFSDEELVEMLKVWRFSLKIAFEYLQYGWYICNTKSSLL